MRLFHFFSLILSVLCCLCGGLLTTVGPKWIMPHSVISSRPSESEREGMERKIIGTHLNEGEEKMEKKKRMRRMRRMRRYIVNVTHFSEEERASHSNDPPLHRRLSMMEMDNTGTPYTAGAQPRKDQMSTLSSTWRALGES